MPIYEYQCKNCQHTFDLLQKFQDEPAKLCPQCQQDTAIRLVSAPGFQLKGTGWYATDFKDKGKASTNDSSKSKPNTETKKAESVTTTKKEETK